jgi:NAD(P)-dependent dehydrogenase (short-subunit alcohol dehydrogenase family)
MASAPRRMRQRSYRLRLRAAFLPPLCPAARFSAVVPPCLFVARFFVELRLDRRGPSVAAIEDMVERAKDPRTREPRPPFPPEMQPHPGFEHEMNPRPDYGEQTYRGHGRLQGKAAVISGGDSGIGRAVALAFAREGADVCVGYFVAERDAQETKKVVEQEGRKCALAKGNITDRQNCIELVETAVRELGHLDIVVNNAAYQGKSVERFEELTAQRIEHTFRTNIIAMFDIVQAALPHLNPGATIINVTSIQAYEPNPEILDYAVTKGAIVTFTKGLARELMPRGIRVNAVAPGAVWTPLIVQSFDEEKISEFGKNNLLGRPAQPVEIAPAFVFLASDDSSFVTGEILGVTGGVLLP